MSGRKANWILTNTQDQPPVQHIVQLCDILLRYNPHGFMVLSLSILTLDNQPEHHSIHQLLSFDWLKGAEAHFLKKNSSLGAFSIDFTHYVNLQQVSLELSGKAPFDQLQIKTHHLPQDLHEMINRKFQNYISFKEKLWSYYYNHKPFRYTLNCNQ